MPFLAPPANAALKLHAAGCLHEGPLLILCQYTLRPGAITLFSAHGCAAGVSLGAFGNRSCTLSSGPEGLRTTACPWYKW